MEEKGGGTMNDDFSLTTKLVIIGIIILLFAFGTIWLTKIHYPDIDFENQQEEVRIDYDTKFCAAEQFYKNETTGLMAQYKYCNKTLKGEQVLYEEMVVIWWNDYIMVAYKNGEVVSWG